MAAPDTLIWIVPTVLSDESSVYHVEVRDDITAKSYDDAVYLADKIMDAINEHSNMTADVTEG